MSYNSEAHLDLKKLIEKVFEWASRPTRDGASNLRNFATELEEKHAGPEKRTCVQCGVQHFGSTWETWVKGYLEMEDRVRRDKHILRSMQPLIDRLSEYYFDPIETGTVCNFCDGGSMPVDKHEDRCPAFIAWQLKPMLDAELAKVEKD